MKKVLNYLRSMRFGILLLILIAALSVVGTLLPQGMGLPYYAERYSQQVYHLIYRLHLFDIYRSWYYQALLALLCLNLILCSAVRLRALLRGKDGELERAAGLPNTERLTTSQREAVVRRLLYLHCREERIGSISVFHKNGLGRYGSFLTHLSILLTVVLGAAALYLPKETTASALIGQTAVLEDGTKITVEDFTLEGEEGRLDFISQINVELDDGMSSGSREVKVNHPLTFGSRKIYQSGYNIQGSVRVYNSVNSAEDLFALEEGTFLTVDGANGVQYLGVSQVTEEGEGLPSGGNTYVAYHIIVVENGIFTQRFVGAGETVTVGQLQFSFQYPYYPIFTVKTMSPVVNVLLIAVFALMVIALYVTFFLPPVLVKVDGEGYAVGGPKPENMKMELAAFLARERGEEL